MAPTVTLIPGRKTNHFNAVLNGYRFCKDKNKNGNTYYRCTFFSTGCRARITLNENNDLVFPTPDHNHETQVAESHVHVMKQALKSKFLVVLKKEQNLAEVKVAQHLSIKQPPKRAKKWTEYDYRLRLIVSDYDSYDLLEFLKAVGNAT
ncbi:hypothetical protein ACHWQZ_G009254 [Mnemiopsis leidyi]